MNPRSANVDPESLRSWIKKAQQGDIGSYQKIYEAFAHKILNFIYRMVNSPQEAEDLTQETFIAVYQKIGTLKDSGKFEPWIFRIARNFVYQKYRTRVPPSVPIDEPDEDGRVKIQLIDKRKNPDESFQSQELEEVVSKVIEGLPEKYKEVFVLSAIQNLSYEQVADIVGRSLASVKTDIHRARLVVRELVKDYLKV
ncbi:MAG: sigma-70 family RNA polymerase sigma factor [Acidobacteriota bacterium]|nr:sigma-70 family RNA polymerase sigma factor [Acidobacteriota bacterium]